MNYREKVWKRVYETKLDGVTDELITSANNSIQNDSYRTQKIIDQLEMELEMVHILLVKHKLVFHEIICNKQLDIDIIRPDILRASGFQVFINPLKSARINNKYAYISPRLWTCNCKVNYIHSRMCPVCEKCNSYIWAHSEQKAQPLSKLITELEDRCQTLILSDLIKGR